MHINSTDALLKPIVDPRYLSHELDAYTQGYALAFVRKLAQAEPLKSIVHSEAWPGTQAVPLDASLQAWTDFARNFTGTECESCAALPLPFLGRTAAPRCADVLMCAVICFSHTMPRRSPFRIAAHATTAFRWCSFAGIARVRHAERPRRRR